MIRSKSELEKKIIETNDNNIFSIVPKTPIGIDYSNKDINENILKNLFVVKKSDKLRNKIILDKIKSTNSNFKLEKCIIKPLINDICNYRTRKNIIPNPLNLKSKKKKNLLSPFILKEYERQFTERRNKIYLNNFYIDSQKILVLFEAWKTAIKYNYKEYKTSINKDDKDDKEKKNKDNWRGRGDNKKEDKKHENNHFPIYSLLFQNY